MTLADPDLTELHVSFKNFITGKPYVDPATGLTSLDLPCEACEVDDVMYAPRVGETSTAHVTLPSVRTHPQYRALYRQFHEGATVVEVYMFQPDAGDPLFKGPVIRGGLTEVDGSLVVDAADSTVQGDWMMVRSYETFDDPPDVLYRRAMSRWTDLLNEDFTAGFAALVAAYGVDYTGPTARGAFGSTSVSSPTTTTFGPGDSVVLEALVGIEWDPTAVGLQASDPRVDLSFFDGSGWDVGFSVERQAQDGAGNVLLLNGLTLVSPAGVVLSASGGSGWPPSGSGSLPLAQYPNHDTARYAMILNFLPSGMLRVRCFIDNVVCWDYTAAWSSGSNDWRGNFAVSTTGPTDRVTMYALRARQLRPYLLRGARFNPQTTQSVLFQPNNDTALSMLRFACEQDNAEYRPIYHPSPQLDDLELDRVGSLGVNASAALGLEAIPTAGASSPPASSPSGAGDFIEAPPFRFEEGLNLVTLAVQPAAETYANDVLRMGANPADSQVSGEAWSTADVGNPALGILPTRPYMEQVSNDDYLGLPQFARQAAGYELARRLDPTPALEAVVAAELPWAGRYRAGDSVLVRTYAMINNLDELLRMMRIRYTAGSPEREVKLGRLGMDADAYRLLLTDMRQQWTRDQQGGVTLSYNFPYTGTVPLPQYTQTARYVFEIPRFSPTTQILNATIQWVTDGANGVDVTGLQAEIGPDVNSFFSIGAPANANIPLTPLNPTDTGPVNVTPCFPVPGVYGWDFILEATAATGLRSATLTITLKE